MDEKVTQIAQIDQRLADLYLRVKIKFLKQNFSKYEFIFKDGRRSQQIENHGDQPVFMRDHIIADDKEI